MSRRTGTDLKTVILVDSCGMVSHTNSRWQPEHRRHWLTFKLEGFDLESFSQESKDALEAVMRGFGRRYRTWIIGRFLQVYVYVDATDVSDAQLQEFQSKVVHQILETIEIRLPQAKEILRSAIPQQQATSSVRTALRR